MFVRIGHAVLCGVFIMQRNGVAVFGTASTTLFVALMLLVVGKWEV